MKAAARRVTTFVGVLTAACGNSEPSGPNVTVATVTVAPDTARIAPGGQVTFTAVPRDAAGAPVTGRAVSWSTSSSGVASVSTGGLVTGVGPGVAEVIAAVDGRSGRGIVIVEMGAVLPLIVSDDFERADGPLGPSWLGNNLTIQSGEVGLASFSGSSLARWVANAFGPDQFSEVTVGSLDGKSFDFFRGLQAFIRQQVSGTPWRYGCHYFSNTLTYQIKYDGGPGTETRLVDESGQEPLPVPGDRIRIEAVGDTIRCYVNGQLKLQGIDGALSGGAIGFVIGLNPGATELPRRIVGSWTGGER